MGAFAALGIPSFVIVFANLHFDPILLAFIFGLGIVGGAFLISWGAEAAQVDLSASFAFISYKFITAFLIIFFSISV